MDIVSKFEWILRNFDKIQPKDKMEFMQFIDQFYNKLQLNFPEQSENKQMELLIY